MNLENLSEQALNLLVKNGPTVLYAIITLLIGLWVIRIVVRVASKVMVRSKVDDSLRIFLNNLLGIILKAMLLITVISMLGVETTSFIAVLGAAGLAVGLALQGSLSNFAGGVLILLFKPYKVGDFVDAQGVAGKINKIQVFNTIMKTPDNKTIIMPNGAISNGIITNFSTEATRRVDMMFGIGYSDDINKAKELLNNLIAADARILKDPEPVVVVSELGDSSVNFTVRVWCNSGDYWVIYFDMHEKVKMTFDQENVSIPFPQRDIHVYNHATGN
jgi:small conductance mechanosensitive channel